MCYLWIQTLIVICLTNHQSTSLWRNLDTATNPDQTLSEDQTYRETLQGIRSYMGWSHIPDIESTTATGDDNPFAGPKSQPAGKVSVRLPTDEWLCNKMAKLNVTLVEGYPSHSSETGGLLRDQFVCPPPPKSQSKWYGLFTDQKPGPPPETQLLPGVQTPQSLTARTIE